MLMKCSILLMRNTVKWQGGDINAMKQNDKFIILSRLFSYIMTEICSEMVQNQPVSHAPQSYHRAPTKLAMPTLTVQCPARLSFTMQIIGLL